MSDLSIASPSLGSRMSRGQVFSAFFAVGMLNGLLWRALSEYSDTPFVQAIGEGFGVSWALWFCAVVGLRLTWEAPAAALTRQDVMVLAAVLAFILWPNGDAAWVGLTLLAAYVLYCNPRAPGSTAGATVVISMMVPLIWARAVVHFFSPWLERVDLLLLHAVAGVHIQGNLMFFPDDKDSLVIAFPCTSFSNLSIAFALWTAVTRLFRPIAVPGEWRDLTLVVVTLVTLNTIRLFLLSRSRDNFSLLHAPVAFNVLDLMFLGATAACSLYGVRHELRL